MSWDENALCRNDPHPERWFNYTKKETTLSSGKAVGGILDLQDICALCPVRQGCGEAALAEESKGDSVTGRYGFRAYMTPEQRAAIVRLGGLRGRDPMKVVMGLGKKTKVRGEVVTETVPPIPEQGIEWNRAHTALARKLTRRLRDTVRPGRNIPGDKTLCKFLGCSPERLHVVLDSLLQSGTLLEHEPGKYVLTTNQRSKEIL